ncbi:Xab2, partial [Symbiodinium necroappetens]
APAQVLVGSPLERAVLCALTCRDSLRLPNGRSIMLSFEQLEAGRLFEKVSATGSELQLARALDSLTPDTLYYDGLNGTERHPLADIWFCAAPNWLVLLDCGGTKKKARKKMSAKSRQISQLVDSGCLSGWKVTMLIFAPAAPSATMPSSTALSDDVDIAIVAGSLATEWLGSWSQLWQYLPDDG